MPVGHDVDQNLGDVDVDLDDRGATARAGDHSIPVLASNDGDTLRLTTTSRHGDGGWGSRLGEGDNIRAGRRCRELRLAVCGDWGAGLNVGVRDPGFIVSHALGV